MSKALIVDDSRSACAVLSRLLKRFNIASDSVNSAAEAFEYLEQQRPSVIFMDHSMPDMDGLEAVTRIKQKSGWKNIPIYMFTAKTGADYLEQIKQAGAVDVIPKSFDLDTIKQSLANVGLMSKAEPQVNVSVAEPSSEQKLQVWLESLIENKVVPALTYKVDAAIQELRHETMQNADQLHRKSLQFHMQQQAKLVKQLEAERDFLSVAYQTQQINFVKKLSVILVVFLVVLAGFVTYSNYQIATQNRNLLMEMVLQQLEQVAIQKSDQTARAETSRVSKQQSLRKAERRQMVYQYNQPVASIIKFSDDGRPQLAESFTGFRFTFDERGNISSFTKDRFYLNPDCFGVPWVEGNMGEVFDEGGRGLWYVPKDNETQNVNVFSKLTAAGECEVFQQSLELHPMLTNEPAVTGMDNSNIRVQP